VSVIELFSFCEFCIIARRFYCKTSTDTSLSLWETQLFQTSLTDSLCVGLLLVSIANASVFFRFMYNVVDKNVMKNNFFILNLFILFRKLHLKYSIKALLWHGSCTWPMDTVHVRGTRNQQPCTRAVNMGVKFGGRVYGLCSLAMNTDCEHGSCEPALRRIKE